MSTATDIVDTGNSIIDAVQAAANNPLIGVIGIAFPQVTAVIDVIRRFGPTIDAAQPIIKAAVEAGEPVFNQVVEQLPKFGTVVSSIMALAPSHFGNDVGALLKVENLARSLGGIGRMTYDEEKAWMDRANPISDDSRSGSG